MAYDLIFRVSDKSKQYLEIIKRLIRENIPASGHIQIVFYGSNGLLEESESHRKCSTTITYKPNSENNELVQSVLDLHHVTQRTSVQTLQENIDYIKEINDQIRSLESIKQVVKQSIIKQIDTL